MDESRWFFDRCVKACADYEYELRRQNVRFEPMGWLVITERQRSRKAMREVMLDLISPRAGDDD